VQFFKFPGKGIQINNSHAEIENKSKCTVYQVQNMAIEIRLSLCVGILEIAAIPVKTKLLSVKFELGSCKIRWKFSDL
jgi:hypothetical protein